MTGVIVNPVLGTILHAFGATSAALCYTPQQKLRGWSRQTKVVYIFSNTGAFVTTALYCVSLWRSQKTFREFRQPRDVATSALPANCLLALLTGCLWYAQFLFYGTAHVRMGTFQFASWAIHMLMLILFSSLAGVVMREWHGRRPRTKAAMVTALLVVAVAVLVLSYGNYLGQQPAGS